MKARILVCLLLIVSLLAPKASYARWMNPSTGRFHTMDTFEGDQRDPQSLHKYLYAADNPVNNIDPTGKSVYVVTRPLDIRNGQAAAMEGYVHVFLAFDTEGLSDIAAWEAAVRESWNDVRHPNSYGITYGPGNSDAATFSFHPKSVLTGDESEQYMGPVLTPSSYVASYARIDVLALSKQGIGYKKWAVASGDDLQMRIFNDAVRSRDRNNNGQPDPTTYSLAVFNCGSWSQYILARHGVQFPDKNVNHGVGLVSATTAPSALAYVAHGAARLTRTIVKAITDVFFTPVY